MYHQSLLSNKLKCGRDDTSAFLVFVSLDDCSISGLDWYFMGAHLCPPQTQTSAATPV